METPNHDGHGSFHGCESTTAKRQGPQQGPLARWSRNLVKASQLSQATTLNRHHQSKTSWMRDWTFHSPCRCGGHSSWLRPTAVAVRSCARTYGGQECLGRPPNI